VLTKRRDEVVLGDLFFREMPRCVQGPCQEFALRCLQHGTGCPSRRGNKGRPTYALAKRILDGGGLLSIKEVFVVFSLGPGGCEHLIRSDHAAKHAFRAQLRRQAGGQCAELELSRSCVTPRYFVAVAI
jgi:hypothetical protein